MVFSVLYSGRVTQSGSLTFSRRANRSDSTHEITWEKWSGRRTHPIYCTSSQTYPNISFSIYHIYKTLIYAEWPLLPEQHIDRVAYVRWSVIMTHQPRKDRPGCPALERKLVTVCPAHPACYDSIYLLDILRGLVPIWTLSACTSPLPVLAHGVPRDITCS